MRRCRVLYFLTTRRTDTPLFLKLKLRILHTSHTLGSTGRKNSTSSIGCHGHAGDTSPDQTRQTPKDLFVHESGDREGGESVGLYVVYMREEEGIFCLLSLLFIINR